MGGEALYPGLTRKSGFAAWLLFWAWLQLGANHCLICSVLQVISLIHSGQPGPKAVAGKSIRLKNIRDPKQVRLGFYGVHVQQSLKVEGMKVKVSDYSERRNEQRGSSFIYNTKAPFGIGQEWIMGGRAEAKQCWGSRYKHNDLGFFLRFDCVFMCGLKPFHTQRKDRLIQASDSW